MRFATLLLAFLGLGPVWAHSYRFELQSWQARCRPAPPSATAHDCGLPVASDVPSRVLELRVESPRLPGEVRTAAVDFGADRVGPLRGRLALYRNAPVRGNPTPAYLQLRLELLAPVRLLCLESVRDDRGPELLPTLHCAGFDPAQPNRQIGFNLVSKSVTDARP